MDLRIKEKLRKATEARFNAREKYWKSLDDPDCIEAVGLIKNVVATTKHLDKIMESL